MCGSIRYTTSKPSLFRWYERLFAKETFTSVIGTFHGLFMRGGPYEAGVSRHFPLIIDKLIKLVPDDHYMLCPLYKKIDNAGGDFQIGITGTSYHDELSENTLQREIAEETGLISSISNIDSFITHNSVKSIYTGTIININDTIVCRNSVTTSCNSTNNIQQKIACIIHGTEQDIIDRYLNQSIIKPWPSNDMIIGSMVIPVKLVKNYMRNRLPKYNHYTDKIPSPWTLEDSLSTLSTRFTFS